MELSAGVSGYFLVHFGLLGRCLLILILLHALQQFEMYEIL